MKYPFFFLLIIAASGCQSALQSAEPQVPTPAKGLSTSSESAISQSAATKKITRSKKCGMSPPVLKQEKIRDMLIKAGEIDPNASENIINQQVQQYISLKRQAFDKKCRK